MNQIPRLGSSKEIVKKKATDSFHATLVMDLTRHPLSWYLLSFLPRFNRNIIITTAADGAIPLWDIPSTLASYEETSGPVPALNIMMDWILHCLFFLIIIQDHNIDYQGPHRVMVFTLQPSLPPLCEPWSKMQLCNGVLTVDMTQSRITWKKTKNLSEYLQLIILKILIDVRRPIHYGQHYSLGLMILDCMRIERVRSISMHTFIAFGL